MIPVGIRWYFRNELESVAAVEAHAAEDGEEAQEADIFKGAVRPPPAPVVFESDDEEQDMRWKSASYWGENQLAALHVVDIPVKESKFIVPSWYVFVTCCNYSSHITAVAHLIAKLCT